METENPDIKRDIKSLIINHPHLSMYNIIHILPHDADKVFAAMTDLINTDDTISSVKDNDRNITRFYIKEPQNV